MIQSVSNGYSNYQNIAPTQNTASSAPIFAMQPQQAAVDTVQFKGQQKPEEESFLAKNWGKILIGGALLAGAYFTHGKLWGKAAEEVAQDTAKAGKGAIKGAEEVGEKGAGVATKEGSVTNNTSQIQSEQINEANVQTTATSKPVVAVPPKTREQLGLEMVETQKDGERKAYINRGQISKMYTEAELSKQFDKQWDQNIRDKMIANFKAHIEDRIKLCAQNGGAQESFGIPFLTPAPGYSSSSAPSFIEYAKALADEMGHSMVNVCKSDKNGAILFELKKK